MSLDSFKTRRTVRVGDATFAYFSLPALAERLGVMLDRMPFSLRVLLENLLRNEDGKAVKAADVDALAHWPAPEALDREVAFYPARVLMPDSSGIPLLIDLAAMRDAVVAQGLDPRRVNPRIPTDLVIDHSVRADVVGSPDAIVQNMKLEMQRNRERYALVRWAMGQFDNLRVIPPGNGILHQLNLECLASVVATRDNVAFPDTLVGMDSHTPMINGLGVFGWGVGGIEAATAMLGDPVSLLVPRVVGCRLVGRRRPGVVCTDIVLSLTQALRRHGVLAAIVEFCGPGLDALSLPDRATIANMAAEYGATMGFFPWDTETIRYLALSGRAAEQVALVEAYARANGLWREVPEPGFPGTAGIRPGRGRALAGRPNPAGGTRSADRRGNEFPRSLRARQRRRTRRYFPGPSVAARRHRDRRDLILHQHQQSIPDHRRRPAGAQRRRPRAAREALGKNLILTRIARCHRHVAAGGPAAGTGGCRLPHRRLWLHDLRRRRRPVAGSDHATGCRS